MSLTREQLAVINDAVPVAGRSRFMVLAAMLVLTRGPRARRIIEGELARTLGMEDGV